MVKRHILKKQNFEKKNFDSLSNDFDNYDDNVADNEDDNYNDNDNDSNS